MKRLFFAVILLSCGCSGLQSNHPDDPFETINRKIYRFNKAFDATMIKPPARLYHAAVPAPVQKGVNNFYQNLQMLPTIANDLLQLKPVVAYKDTWRLFINSTFGLLGFIDIADKWGLPYHYNDLGMTLGRLGNTHSPYIVLPVLGPSTLRDTFAFTLEYSLLSIYPHITPPSSRYQLIGFRVVDIRADILDKEDVLEEALDEYSFVRDAYLQSREESISGSDSQNYLDENPDNTEPTDDDFSNIYIDDDFDELAQKITKDTIWLSGFTLVT